MRTPSATASVEDNVRAVETTINYVAPGSFINRRFVAPGIERNTGRYEAHRVLVRDGRSIAARFSLDVHGFVLTRQPTKVADFFAKDQVDLVYPDEVITAVRSLTGATRVAPLGWMVRTSGDLSRHRHQTVGYTPFHDPSFSDARVRESIEFRTIAYFE